MLTMTIEADAPPAGAAFQTVVMPQCPVPRVVDTTVATAQAIVSASA